MSLFPGDSPRFQAKICPQISIKIMSILSQFSIFIPYFKNIVIPHRTDEYQEMADNSDDIQYTACLHYMVGWSCPQICKFNVWLSSTKKLVDGGCSFSNAHIEPSEVLVYTTLPCISFLYGSSVPCLLLGVITDSKILF